MPGVDPVDIETGVGFGVAELLRLGKHFVATGSILRAGNKVAVSRMDLRNDEGTHIATATGTYLIG